MLRLLFGLVAVLFVLYLLSGLKLDTGAGESRKRAAPGARMTRAEALLVLGLTDGATKPQIAARYRELVRKVHPDTPGGSTYLTAQVNQARDVLLG